MHGEPINASTSVYAVMDPSVTDPQKRDHAENLLTMASADWDDNIRIRPATKTRCSRRRRSPTGIATRSI
jgi:hypothetical protein